MQIVDDELARDLSLLLLLFVAIIRQLLLLIIYYIRFTYIYYTFFPVLGVGACTEVRKRTNETTDVFDGVRRRTPLRKQIRIDHVHHHAIPMVL